MLSINHLFLRHYERQRNFRNRSQCLFWTKKHTTDMDKIHATHPAAAQTAARRWARIIGKGEYRATETGAAGWVGGGKHSSPLGVGLGWGGQLGPVKSEFVGPALSPGEAPFTLDFDLPGQLAQSALGDAILKPSVDRWRFDFQHAGHRRNPAKQVDDFGVGHVHGVHLSCN
jgi:hypothetical protein